MKVLFFLTSLGAGGTESSTAALLPALRERGIECEVAVIKREEVGYERRVLDDGFTIHEIAGTNIAQRVRSMRRLLRNLEPDILHTAIFDADLVGRLAGWRLPVRVVSSLVNTSYDPIRLQDLQVPRWKLRVVQSLDGITARLLTDRMHAVSEGVAIANARDLKLPRDHIDVVERGRDPALLRPSTSDARHRVRRELGIADEVPVVLAVGRVEYQKGHVVLVDAMQSLSEAAPDIVRIALIVGRVGNASADVERRIEEAGLSDRVRLLGHRTDIPDLLAAADVFVLPSRYEGTAGVVIEAMAAGVPIVSSDVQGLRGVLEHGATAVCVPVGDVEALTTAIDHCLGGGDAVADMVTRAHERFLEAFTIDRAADRMVGFYGRVMSAG